MSFNFPMTWKLLESLSRRMSNDRSGVTFPRIFIFKFSAQGIILLSLLEPFENSKVLFVSGYSGSGLVSDFQCLSVCKFSATLCFCLILAFQKWPELSYRPGSAVKSSNLFSKRFRFNSQYPHISSQLSEFLVPRNSTSSLATVGIAHTWYKDTHVSRTPTCIKKKRMINKNGQCVSSQLHRVDIMIKWVNRPSSLISSGKNIKYSDKSC